MLLLLLLTVVVSMYSGLSCGLPLQLQVPPPSCHMLLLLLAPQQQLLLALPGSRSKAPTVTMPSLPATAEE